MDCGGGTVAEGLWRRNCGGGTVIGEDILMEAGERLSP